MAKIAIDTKSGFTYVAYWVPPEISGETVVTPPYLDVKRDANAAVHAVTLPATSVDVATTNTGCSIAAYPDGRVCLVYAQNGVLYTKRSTDWGATWA